jgi:hypothetical protein
MTALSLEMILPQNHQDDQSGYGFRPASPSVCPDLAASVPPARTVRLQVIGPGDETPPYPDPYPGKFRSIFLAPMLQPRGKW